MSDHFYFLQNLLEKKVTEEGYDLIGVQSVPKTNDRLLKLRTVEEFLSEFDQDKEDGTISFIVGIRPKTKTKGSEVIIEQISNADEENGQSAYLENGKLNEVFLLKNAEILIQAGEYHLAKNIYKKFIQANQSLHLAYQGIGVCEELEGHLELAIKNYEESIAYHPSLPVLKFLIKALITQNRAKYAIEIIERALLFRGIDSETQFELLKVAGNITFDQSEYERANEFYTKALSLKPTADEIKSNQAAVFLKQGKLQESKRSYEDALSSNPKNLLALLGIAEVHFNLGNRKEALFYYSEALNIDIKNQKAIFYLVKLSYELKLYEMAEKYLKKYIEFCPISASILYSLAGVQFHLKKYVESKNTCEKIIQIRSDHEGAHGLIKKISSL